MALRALPARNQATWSLLNVWWLQNSTRRPSGFVIAQRTSRSGASVGQSEHADAVVLADVVVGRGLDERQGEHALLLQVGLVDPGERASDDDEAAAVARLHGRVLA